MSDEPKKNEQAPEIKTEPSGEPLPESELDKVAGGLAPFHIVKLLDKSSAKLFE